jgi:hypothetical protein
MGKVFDFFFFISFHPQFAKVADRQKNEDKSCSDFFRFEQQFNEISA